MNYEALTESLVFNAGCFLLMFLINKGYGPLDSGYFILIYLMLKEFRSSTEVLFLERVDEEEK
jgi:hypothetical protein